MQTVEEIMQEMAKNIRCDIYGDIYGHDYWAEELLRLREEVSVLRDSVNMLKQKAIEDSWARSPDRSGGQFTQEEINYRERERW